jgi:endonuclease/exonuclease/phosphatase family metal-dependent hydrolase
MSRKAAVGSARALGNVRTMRRARLAGLLGLLIACGGGSPPGAPDAGDPPGGDAPSIDPPDAGGPAFDEAPTDEPAGPLCDIPPGYVEAGGDPRDPPCRIEIGAYRAPDPAYDGALRVVAWNVEFGKDTATITSMLATRPELAGADVLLLSEVPRHSLTSEPDDLDLAHDLAIARQMSYAFAVEWDRRELPDELGEHGVAILSRFPLGNARFVRHTQVNDWWAEDRLYGGRVSLGVDLLVNGAVITVYVTHYDTRGTGDAGRAMQAAETRADADLPGRPAIQIAGGDFNTWTCNPAIANCIEPPDAEATVEDFLADGWSDGTAGWNGFSHLGIGFFPQRLDWMFYRGAAATPGQADGDATGSDHKPIYFDLHPVP